MLIEAIRFLKVMFCTDEEEEKDQTEEPRHYEVGVSDTQEMKDTGG